MRKLAMAISVGIIFCTFSAHAAQQKLALLLKARHNSFYDAILLGARESAAEFGYEIDPVYGKDEDDWQEQVRFLTTNVDRYAGFMLVPARSDRFQTVLHGLKEKKRPVVVIDTPLTSGSEEVLATVTSDNVLGGKLAGTYIANEIEKRKIVPKCVALFSGNEKAKTHQDRNFGFAEVIHTRFPGLKIVVYPAMSSFELAKAETIENRKAISGCSAVFAGSDTMILGVAAAFDGRGDAPPILVGYDAILEAQRLILKDKISATVQQSPREMGISAVRSLAEHFNNRGVKADQVIVPRLTVRSVQLDSLRLDDLELIR